MLILLILFAAAGAGYLAFWCGYTVGYDHGRNDMEDGFPHRDDAPLWMRWQRMWGTPSRPAGDTET